MPDTEPIVRQLLNTDDEFRELFDQHHTFESRLSELSEKHYLSESEQVEGVTLKKRKLQLKDRMEQIIRKYRDTGAAEHAQAARPGSATGG